MSEGQWLGGASVSLWGRRSQWTGIVGWEAACGSPTNHCFNHDHIRVFLASGWAPNCSLQCFLGGYQKEVAPAYYLLKKTLLPAPPLLSLLLRPVLPHLSCRLSQPPALSVIREAGRQRSSGVCSALAFSLLWSGAFCLISASGYGLGWQCGCGTLLFGIRGMCDGFLAGIQVFLDCVSGWRVHCDEWDGRATWKAMYEEEREERLECMLHCLKLQRFVLV